jgi:hypothetical protein
MVGDGSNEQTGLVMMPVAKDMDIEGMSVVDAVIDRNLGDELHRVCALRKGICDVMILVQVNGVDDEYLKAIFELLGQLRGLFREREVGEAFGWSSSTHF